MYVGLGVVDIDGVVRARDVLSRIEALVGDDGARSPPGALVSGAGCAERSDGCGAGGESGRRYGASLGLVGRARVAAQPGSHGLGESVGAAVRRVPSCGLVQSVVVGILVDAVEGAFDAFHDVGRMPAQLGVQLPGCVKQGCAVFVEVIDEADACGAGGIDGTAGECQLAKVALIDEQGKALEAPEVGDDTEFRLRKGEGGSAGGIADVAGADQFQGGTGALAVDEGR